MDSNKAYTSDFYKDCTVLPEFLDRSAALWPDRVAYRWYDRESADWKSYTWKEFADEVARWRRALDASGLEKGDRVAVLLTNSIYSLLIDQAVLANGMIPVPMHASDTPSACSFVLQDSGARALVIASEARWNSIRDAAGTPGLFDLGLVVMVYDKPGEGNPSTAAREIMAMNEWLKRGDAFTGEARSGKPAPDDLAALVYTSGTTGRPKGVMLSHSALLANVWQCDQVVPIDENDVYLSYLPLSHAFERTFAYYISVATGAQLVISRGVSHLLEDLQVARPTVMNTVPRVLETFRTKLLNDAATESEKAAKDLAWTEEVGWRLFCEKNDLPVEHTARAALDAAAWPDLNKRIAGRVRALFGGRIRDLISGGAPLNYSIAKFFCAMGINLRQGYGLTESAPVISVTTTEGNHPTTVGHPLPGIEAKLDANDELIVRGPQVMKGYWNRPDATRDAFTEDGFLRTGDLADLSDGGRIRIKGRIKEIIVTSTGEKIPPVDLEFAIMADPLFEQVLAVGEGHPYISCLAVVNPEQWKTFCGELGLDPEDPASYDSKKARRAAILRIKKLTKHFPQYGVPRVVRLLEEHWTPDNGLTTTTMKLRRAQIHKHFINLIDDIYRHGPA